MYQVYTRHALDVLAKNMLWRRFYIEHPVQKSVVHATGDSTQNILVQKIVKCWMIWQMFSVLALFGHMTRVKNTVS